MSKGDKEYADKQGLNVQVHFKKFIKIQHTFV